MSWRLLLHQAVPTWIPCRTHTRSHRKPEARALLPQKQHSCVRMDALTSEEVEHNSLQGPPNPRIISNSIHPRRSRLGL